MLARTTIVAATLLLAATPVWAADDEQAIRDLEVKFGQAFINKDVDAIMKVYAPDVHVFDVVPPRQYVGGEAYRQDWENYLGSIDGPVQFTIGDLDITVDGNLGFSHMIQYVKGTDTKGQNFDSAFRITDVYQKINGEWLIVHEHVSVPVDLETGTPDMKSSP